MENETKYGHSDSFDYDGYKFRTSGVSGETDVPADFIVNGDIAYFRGPDGFLWFATDQNAYDVSNRTWSPKRHFSWECAENAEMHDLWNYGANGPEQPICAEFGAMLAQSVDLVRNLDEMTKRLDSAVEAGKRSLAYVLEHARLNNASDA